MGQTWADLLFMHWRVPQAALRGLVPGGLELDTYDGHAWLGVTPFRITGLRLRGTLPVPGLSSFPELNVRTYVTHAGRPGIFFLSLDAASGPAVAAARRFYRLPYFRAQMSVVQKGSQVDFSSVRTEPGAFPRSLRAVYEPAGVAAEASRGTLEHFLTERYCLYTVDGTRLYRAEIHHGPWTLQPAEVQLAENTMPPRSLALSGAPLAHFSRRQDVVIWPLEPAISG